MSAASRQVVPFKVSIPSLAMSDEELLEVMENSVYPGADRKSIKLVLSYCRGVQKDPLKKVVHIVPMDVKVKAPDGKSSAYVKRDVIMEGVASYRMDAARTGEHVGTTKPVFGPSATLTWFEQQENGADLERSFEYPEWCEITVTRVVDGKDCQFTALEYWVENYATAARNSKAPNTMWKKRVRGQLAKCTEAQALRKAFPDTVSSAPTVEEMEGKVIDQGEDATPARTQIEGPTKKEPAGVESPDSAKPGTDAQPADTSHAAAARQPETEKPMSEGQKGILRAKLLNAGLNDLDIEAKFGKGKKLGKTKGEDSGDWLFSQFDLVQTWIAGKVGQ